ncbi:MAG: prepilin peptidase [Eubacteriales bacterium]|nr:prepilin peptidase [Eubacteriales bacterium]
MTDAQTVFYGIFLLGLLTTAWTDGKERRISNRTVCLLALLRAGALAARALTGSAAPEEAGESLLGAAAGGGLLLAGYLARPDGIGAGDVKLFAAAGFWLGWERFLYAGGLALALAVVWGVLLPFFGGDEKEGVPLAPFLCAGTMLLLLWEKGGAVIAGAGIFGGRQI